MASAPIYYGFNLLEKGTVTVTTESTSQPKERLFDRDVGLTYSAPGSTATREIKVNRAGNPDAVTAWAISSCHGLVSVPLTLDSSPDNVVWTNRDSVTPTSSGRLIRTLSGVTADWWRLQATGATGAIEVGELLFTKAVTAPKVPLAAGPQQADVATLARHESRAGKVWKATLAANRWEAVWTFANLTSSERDTVSTFFTDDIDGGAKPFYVTDPEGTTRWVEWMDPEARFTGHSGRLWNLTVKLREVL